MGLSLKDILFQFFSKWMRQCPLDDRLTRSVQSHSVKTVSVFAVGRSLAQRRKEKERKSD